MLDALMTMDKKGVDCAFYRFFSRKLPVFVDHRVYGEGRQCSFHNHDFPQLWICVKGKYLHRVGDEVQECGANSVVLVPIGYYHTFLVLEDSTELISLNLMYDIFLNVQAKAYINTISNMFLPSCGDQPGDCKLCFRIMSEASMAILEDCVSWLSVADFRVFSAKECQQIYRTVERIFSVPELALAEEYHKKATLFAHKWMKPIVRVLSWLNIHYSEKITESDLVKIAGIGHTELFRRFRCLTGYTYTNYLQRLRVQHVDTYLMHTNYSIAYISDICGFVSQAYMTKIYKVYVGKTPYVRRMEHKQWLGQHPERKLYMTGF